ncbi:hypothetical protein [Streptomyces fumanus]|uniref:Uncharacterized protein n=1 Tax=Streptomyces fumanus TaxID=67302 RepID=A0A919A3I2_9ACTN|nr:hypothetical protein [Streptomyces fumanus]GHE84757.1 hypothetical protein GCM10018772_04780 [Streptomyces fumanus]
MKTNPISQLSAATALVQLLTEHPDLPALSWRISAHERLAGIVQGSHTRNEDPRPIARAWAAALGTEVVETEFVFEDEPNVECSVETVWRDVRVRIVMSCPVSALAETAVAA